MHRWALAAGVVVLLGACGGSGGESATDAPRWDAVDVAADLGLAEVAESWDAEVHDFDGDGDDDVLLGRHLDPRGARLMRNDGGRFAEVNAGTFLTGVDGHDCAWADVDNSGTQDLYCSIGAERGTGTGLNQLWLQGPDGSFAEAAEAWGVTDPYGRGRGVVFVDVNGDDFVDLFVGNDAPREDAEKSLNRIYLNEGGKRFRPAPELGLDVELGNLSAVAADVDRDGWQDLLVCARPLVPRPRLRLFRNVEGRAFEEVGADMGLSPLVRWGAELADLNGDDRLDIVMVAVDRVEIQLNEGDRFAEPVEVAGGLVAGVAVAAGDADGDDDLDLYVVQRCDEELRDQADLVLFNDGNGTDYETFTVEPQEGCGDTVRSTDFDGDGRREFMVLNGRDRQKGPIQVLRSK